MKRLIRAYFEEARWLNQGHIPSFDEHLSVSLISSGYPMLIANSFVGIKDIVSNEVLEWLSKDPKIVRNSTIIARFMDDIVSHKVEQERDHVMSTVECYMNQYGVSEQAAVDELNRQVVNAWKETNEEFIRPTAVPSSILVRVLNFSRVIDLLYKDDDGYTRVGKVTKDSVAALLIDSVPL
ncbi:alpha-humulene synthase-like [Humulus lupulus]|uniref:alpha-humulene synthase-like n=1 Tax=Humulus lupulus TaxID=3486 RepID=UPI002B407CB5|nr:alpha-humulene synthase-like [Humulus lupulus]